MVVVAKATIMLIGWAVLVTGLARTYAGRRTVLAAGCAAGLIIGTVAASVLFTWFSGGIPFTAIKSVLAVAFLSLFAVAAFIWYSPAAPAVHQSPALPANPYAAGTAAVLSATAYAALVVGRLPSSSAHAVATVAVLLILQLLMLWIVLYLLEPRLPLILTMARGGMPLLIVSLLLWMASASPRLDLFAPLSMKVMKLIHDFVHQFFESMLIPDHPFFRTEVWNYIGLLFSNSVGFWGGLAIWFAPVIWLAAAVFRQGVPSVGHLRQSAKRRKLLAEYLRGRRWRLFFPVLSAVIMGMAIYNSCFPAVEYWDPKPVPVKADRAGQITIPVQSEEMDLRDGRLHKFLLQEGGTKVRFFVLFRSGEMTAVLDACSICQPEGYGQSEGTVICYYCKTLIPLETVGKPGGCNPVPVPFTVDAAGVHLSAASLVGTWNEQVQSAKKVSEGRR